MSIVSRLIRPILYGRHYYTAYKSKSRGEMCITSRAARMTHVVGRPRNNIIEKSMRQNDHELLFPIDETANNRGWPRDEITRRNCTLRQARRIKLKGNLFGCTPCRPRERAPPRSERAWNNKSARVTMLLSINNSVAQSQSYMCAPHIIRESCTMAERFAKD